MKEMLKEGTESFSSRIQQEISRGINQVTEERLVIDPYTADLNFKFN